MHGSALRDEQDVGGNGSPESLDDVPAPPIFHPIPKPFPKAALAAGDLVAITIAMVAAYVLRRSFPDPEFARTTAAGPLPLGLACLPAWLLVFCHFRLYAARSVSSRRAEC